MIDNIRKLVDESNSIKLEDITFSNYGSEFGFSEVQIVKNETCDFLITILDGLKNYYEYIDQIIIEDLLNTVSQSLQNIKGKLAEIQSLIKNGVNRPEYPRERLLYIQQFKSIAKNTRKNLLQAKILIDGIANKIILDESSIDNLRQRFEQIIVNSEKKRKELEKVLSNEQDKSIVSGVNEGIETFDKLGKIYKISERSWFIALVIFAILTISSLSYIIFWMPQFNKNETFIQTINNIDSTKIKDVDQKLILDNSKSDTSENFISYLIKKIMILIVPLVFFKICMSKYNTERHLRIIYDHRAIVLQQYRDFENAIGDDSTSKNQLRMEIAKYIFSDPQTGYIKDSSANEVNFNPVINLLESLKTKA